MIDSDSLKAIEIGDRPRFFREKELISIHFNSPNKSMQPTRYVRG
jgi:hypothetical protein